MAVQKSGDDVRLIAVEIVVLFFADKIAQHGFGDFRVGVLAEGPPQHGRRNGHVEQA